MCSRSLAKAIFIDLDNVNYENYDNFEGLFLLVI